MATLIQCFQFLCFSLVLVLGYYASQALSRPLDEHKALSIRERHEHWMKKHERTYKDLAEKEKRFNIFKNNVEYVENFNHASSSNQKLYTLGVNGFADLTDEEFQATHTGSKSISFSQSKHGGLTSSFRFENVIDMPSSLDWRDFEVVTPIKDQGKCGCCWAFASVATVEGLNKLKTGNLISLSAQQLNDCVETNNGCRGGNIQESFKYIQQNQGISSDSEYPYISYMGMEEECRSVQGQSYSVTIDGFENVPSLNEDALLQAVSRQPVAVLVDSSGFKLYNGGIYNGDCGTNLDHYFTIIGYGTENGYDYWLIKNSWGTQWGEQGYMRIMRGTNMCGLATDPSYPI